MSPDPAVTVELHRLRLSRTPVTLTLRGGHRQDGVHIAAVHRHHTVFHRDGRGEQVLLPLRFIHAVAPHTSTTTVKESTTDERTHSHLP